MRTPTPAPFREQIALMMKRLGHTIITDPTMISICGQPQMLKCSQVVCSLPCIAKSLYSACQKGRYGDSSLDGSTPLI